MPKFDPFQQSLFSSLANGPFLDFSCVRCTSSFQVIKVLVLSPGDSIKRFLPLCSYCREKL